MTKEQLAAQKRAKAYLQEYLKDSSGEKAHKMAIGYWGSSCGWTEEMEIDGRCVRKPSGEHCQIMLEHTSTDPAAWDAACLLSAGLLEEGRPVPPLLARFAASVLKGEIKRPPKNKNAWSTLSRDLPLCVSIADLLEAGFPRSINNSPASTAFDVVLDICCEFGVYLSLDMMEKIWARHKDHVLKTRSNGPFYYREPEKADFPIRYSERTKKSK